MAQKTKASQSAEFMCGLAKLLNKVGPDDPRVDEFIEAHKTNRTFKRALMPKKKKGKR